MKLAGKTILITGASSGIGKELAEQLAHKGCRLVLAARRKELLDEVVAGLPGNHICYACDVTDQQQIADVCNDVIAENIKIDVLIANAGVGGGFDVNNIDLEGFHNQFDVNFFGAVTFIKYLAPCMIKRGQGIIAATSSLAGYRGMPVSAPYSSSKAALSNFMEALRIDLWRTGVKVVLISPGFVKSPLTDKNNFKMPFLMPVDKAGRIIIRGIEREKPEIHFPYSLSIPLKIIRLLPLNWYARLMQNRRN